MVEAEDTEEMEATEEAEAMAEETAMAATSEAVAVVSEAETTEVLQSHWTRTIRMPRRATLEFSRAPLRSCEPTDVIM